MKLFSSGIDISAEDKKILDHIVADVDAWLIKTITSKVSVCKDRFTEKWTPIYNASSTAIPSTEKAFIDSIATQAGYKTRKASDAADGTKHETHPTTSGPVKLLSGGVTIDDTDAKAVLAQVPDIEQWVRGAIAGKLTKSIGGLKEEWAKKLWKDEDYTDSLPGPDAEWINVVTARDKYEKRLQF